MASAGAGHSLPAPCLFGDIEHCLPVGAYDKNSCFMEKLRDISSSQLMRRQWCYQHGSYCNLFGPGAVTQFEIAGLPCWDMSLAGKRLAEEGQTCSVFMCHAKIHKERRTPLLLLENVQAGVSH